ncbi:MAG TPA: N-methyl-L-tryptophan oxidase [Actinomycetes bacterium]|nr:N-methyl-L-tryptophan oxidase [Actinomycetes bacterium]
MTEGDRPAKRPRTSPAGPSWDVVVVGLGALGSAAAWVLARSGARVLALEQFELGHHRGASHDHARIIRRSYHTPAYVRLAGLAYRAWAELEWEAEERLVVTTGGLDLFPADSAIPHGPYRSSLEACGVPYQWLDAAEVMRRWPAFRLDADVHGLWQPDAGMVPADRGTRLMRHLATGYGATLVSQAPVTAVRDLGGSVEVATPEASFRAGRLLLCTDAWTGDLLAQLGAALPLVVTQEQFSYFRPADPAAFAVGRFPVWIWMDDPSFYGFPVWPDTALKAAQDVGGPRVTATTRGFDPDPAASERLAGFLRARLPAAVGAHDHTATCLYTLTPDRDLVLGPLPGHDLVLVALGAAHGFKFAPLLGRVLADLALHGGTDVDLTPFAPDRPALTAPEPEARYLV